MSATLEFDSLGRLSAQDQIFYQLYTAKSLWNYRHAILGPFDISKLNLLLLFPIYPIFIRGLVFSARIKFHHFQLMWPLGPLSLR